MAFLPVMNVTDFKPETKTIDLGNGEKMTFVRIPAGEFMMGNADGYPDERPKGVVKIEKPFWMSTTELRNRDYALFDPEHDSRYIGEHGKDHAVPGYIANHPNQPVIRVTWQRAMEFCDWFSKTHNVKATLPTEAQWEWAARAGTTSQFFYGDRDTDFSPFANLADKEIQNSYTSWSGGSVVHPRRPYAAELMYPLYDPRFKDNWFVGDYVAQVKPNAWGLYDMVGNVNEWTRSDYLPYPYTDAANTLKPDTKKVARGGSWATRPKDAGSTVRYWYETWQVVTDVGFRVIIED
jgi:formylglycine-generating enzyme required for sulfatase activity